MNEMSEYYQSLKGLKSKPKVVPKKPSHKGNWNLIYSLGRNTTNILTNKPRAICEAKKQELLRSGQYRLGKIAIIPYK